MISEIQQDELLTVKEAKAKYAKRLGYRRILKACRDGDLPAELDGNSYKFMASDFLAWLRRSVLKRKED